MNLIEFNKILSHPNQIKKGQIQGLSELIEEYPYFQVTHYLHLNGLKNQHSFKYNDYLKKTAAYTTDRTVLFDHITSDDLDIHAAPADLIDQESASKENINIAPVFKEKAAIIEESSPEETLGIGEPLQFNRDETHSFREWLQLSSFTPIQRDESSNRDRITVDRDKGKTGPKGDGNMDLIDQFIAASPKINPSLYDNYTDVAMDSVQENESLMTETLAHVYVEQKKYKKAITAFTILSLKYPEKSSFFANQIEAIKKLEEK
jgi:hypothetical protein